LDTKTYSTYCITYVRPTCGTNDISKLLCIDTVDQEKGYTLIIDNSYCCCCCCSALSVYASYKYKL